MLKTGFPWHTDFHDAMKLNEVKLKEKGFRPYTVKARMYGGMGGYQFCVYCNKDAKNCCCPDSDFEPKPLNPGECDCTAYGWCDNCGPTCKHWRCSCNSPNEEGESEYCAECGNGSKDCQCMNPEFWRETSALSMQKGGTHYKDKKIQPVEYAHANNLGFMEANVVKYITRHKDKNNAEDIRKAIHYCQLILELEYNEGVK